MIVSAFEAISRFPLLSTYARTYFEIRNRKANINSTARLLYTDPPPQRTLRAGNARDSAITPLFSGVSWSTLLALT